MCSGNNLEPEQTLWVGSVGSATLEPAHCFHWSRNTSSPSITSDFHLALATQIHVDLDWTEFKRNISSEILEFCPLGILSIRRSTLWRCFICWNILVPNKIHLVLRNLPDEMSMLLQSGRPALRMHITGPKKNALYSFCYSFTNPCTFLVIFSCSIWKDKDREGVIMLLTWALVCSPLSRSWCQGGSPESALKTVKARLFSSNEECWGPKSFSTYGSVDQTVFINYYVHKDFETKHSFEPECFSER